MNIVKIAAMNICMSIKKLLMNVLNFDVGLSHLVVVILFSWYCSIKSLSITGACINWEFNWKESKEMESDCLTLVQFLFYLIVLNSLQKLNLQWSIFLDLVFHVLYMWLMIQIRNYFLLQCHSYTKCSYLVRHRCGLVCLPVCYYYKCILFFCNWTNLQELFAFLHLKQIVLYLTCCDNSKNHKFL